MGKYLRIFSYIRKPFLIYDFATAPLWISLYMRKIWFFFISVYKLNESVTACVSVLYTAEVQRRPDQYSSSILFDCFISVLLCVEYGDLSRRREQQLKNLCWKHVQHGNLPYCQPIAGRETAVLNFSEYICLCFVPQNLDLYIVILISFYTVRNGLIYSIVVQMATPEAVRHER
jgi:hypothetical protein